MRPMDTGAPGAAGHPSSSSYRHRKHSRSFGAASPPSHGNAERAGLLAGRGKEEQTDLSWFGARVPPVPPVGNLPSRTGLAYDTLMCRHQCSCQQQQHRTDAAASDGVTKPPQPHLEQPSRIQAIWARLTAAGLTDRCERIPARKAPWECLRLVHADSYLACFGAPPPFTNTAGSDKRTGSGHTSKTTTTSTRTTSSLSGLIDKPAAATDQSPHNHHHHLVKLACGGMGVDLDTYYAGGQTTSAARMAAGCVVDMSLAVAAGHLQNGFALVRPPGHHAESDQALGFCYFNNVAVAARVLQQQCGLKRICIFDWDVHHGNGTQLAFEADPDVLYVSLHRHDEGNFYPGTGSNSDVGLDRGEGFTVNIGWSESEMTDVEYLAAWRAVVAPILTHFDPEFILVSAGFDGTSGHPSNLGGYKLSRSIFSTLLARLLRCQRYGRVVLALEGGYDLASTSECAAECVRVLTGDAPTPFPDSTLNARPCFPAIACLSQVIRHQTGFWPGLRHDLINMSEREWQQSQLTDAPPVTPLAIVSPKLRPSPPKSSNEDRPSLRRHSSRDEATPPLVIECSSEDDAALDEQSVSVKGEQPDSEDLQKSATGEPRPKAGRFDESSVESTDDDVKDVEMFSSEEACSDSA